MSKTQGQRRRALGRARQARRGRVPLVLLHLEAAVGRLPLLARDGRRVGAPVPDARSGTPTASTSCTRTSTDVAAASRRRPTSTAGSARGCQPPSQRVIERIDDYDTTSAGRAIAEFVDDLSNWYVRRTRRRFWDGRRRRASAHAARVPARRSRSCWRRSRRSWPTRSTTTSTAPSPRSTSATSRSPGARDERARVATCRSRATPSSWAAPRAAQAKIKVRQPLREAVVVADERERAAIARLRGPGARRAEREGARYVAEAEELAATR